MKRKDTIELTVIGIALFILAFLIIGGLRRGKKTTSIRKRLETKVSEQKELQGEQQNTKEQETKPEGLYKKLEEETKNLKLTRDPFNFGPMESSEGVSVLKLKGIFLDKEVPMAIINDYVVAVGDKVGTNTIIEIKQDRVILNDGINDFELRLR